MKKVVHFAVRHFCSKEQQTVLHEMAVEIGESTTHLDLAIRLDSDGRAMPDSVTCQHCGMRIPQPTVVQHEIGSTK